MPGADHLRGGADPAQHLARAAQRRAEAADDLLRAGQRARAARRRAAGRRSARGGPATGGGGGGRPFGSGSRSKRTVVMSTPETPSTSAWWLLPIDREAAVGAGPRPATAPRAACERSSCWEKIRAARLRSCSSEPGAGRAVWRTWYSRFRWGSSTQTGRPWSKRHEAQLLAEAGHQVQPRGDVVAELLVGGRGPLEDDRRGDVHVGALPLHVEERGVEPGQPVGIATSASSHTAFRPCSGIYSALQSRLGAACTFRAVVHVRAVTRPVQRRP